LAELRFDSIAGWLPENEAAALRAEFHRELDRLYALLASAVGACALANTGTQSNTAIASSRQV
jgi:hypothetical protein